VILPGGLQGEVSLRAAGQLERKKPTGSTIYRLAGRNKGLNRQPQLYTRRSTSGTFSPRTRGGELISSPGENVGIKWGGEGCSSAPELAGGGPPSGRTSCRRSYLPPCGGGEGLCGNIGKAWEMTSHRLRLRRFGNKKRGPFTYAGGNHVGNYRKKRKSEPRKAEAVCTCQGGKKALTWLTPGKGLRAH